MTFELAFWFVFAYFVGATPFGVLIARHHGVNLFQVGSGNTGATNVYRALGKKPALAVFALDVLKGVLPAMIVRGRTGSEEWALAVGLCAVLGHSLSPFLNFRGGKGISTGLGALLGSSPAVALSTLGSFLIAFGLSGYVSLSSLISAVAMVGFGFLYARSPTLIGAFGTLAVWVTVRHLPNIRRLIDGTEPKFSLQNAASQAADSKGPGENGPSAVRTTAQPSDHDAPESAGQPSEG